jgi:CRP-like cAMP-binding protein
MLLLALASNYGKTTDDGVAIDLPVSRRVISEMLGISVDTLSRVIKRFRDRDLIGGAAGASSLPIWSD